MERNSGVKSPEDRLVSKLVIRITEGDEALQAAIFQTLQIDGETHPTIDQVREFVAQTRKGKRNARRPNRE